MPVSESIVSAPSHDRQGLVSPYHKHSGPVVVAVASGPQELAEAFIREASRLAGDHAFYVISEFAPPEGIWIPFRFERTDRENLDRCRAEFLNRKIHLCCVLIAGNGPYGRMRWLAFHLAPARGVYFNENLDHFMARPRSLPVILRHVRWRVLDWFRFQFQPGGWIYTVIWRLFHPAALERPMLYTRAFQNGRHLALHRPERIPMPLLRELPDGVAVVIPSRNGKELLESCLPRVIAESPDQVIVVDNGSTDGTAEWLKNRYPAIEVDVSETPLSFAAAVNRGVRQARFSRVCLLNNDMEIEPGFFTALERAFQRRKDLFCATAQIFFPEEKRREETGKAVMPPQLGIEDFPIRCAEPIPGENYTDVLYGSGGCSMYRTAMLEALGGFDENFAPAYVEDLDLGYRGWLAGGATVFVSDAKVLHRHRSTTARYFTPEQIETAVEQNYLRFLKRGVASPDRFTELWTRAVTRLNHMAAGHNQSPAAMAALRFASELDAPQRRLAAIQDDETIFSLGAGEFARFPGKPASGKPVVVIASCYAPFPLAHGGAVRIYNLIKRTATDFDQVLLYFADGLSTPPSELLQLAVEIIVVQRRGSHVYSSRELPDGVQDFQSDAFRAVLRSVIRQWRAEIVQLEFTQMAQYAADCVPARTILVEHDVTIDLYRQLLERTQGTSRWEVQYQLTRWERFERQTWQQVNQVVVMSERDRAIVGSSAFVLPNGVDTARFQPSPELPERGRLLFIGSFAHLPNLLAIKFFVDEVWPRLSGTSLHVIAGDRPEYYLDYHRNQVSIDFSQRDIELDAFVSDVRPAYRRAQIVIAPLRASAGTNIKIIEAMAMGKAIVATKAAIHGLELSPGIDVVIAESADEMARVIRDLVANPHHAREIGSAARSTVCARYDWGRIAEVQKRLYATLRATTA